MKFQNILAITICLCLSISISAQTENQPSSTLTQATTQEVQGDVYKVVGEMPRFPGCEDIEGDNKEKKSCGDKKLLEYISNNLVYPAEAKEKGIEGTTILKFIVTKEGKIAQIEIFRDLCEECETSCGQAAKAVIEKMGTEHTWIPGRHRGNPVNVKMHLPVSFRL